MIRETLLQIPQLTTKCSCILKEASKATKSGITYSVLTRPAAMSICMRTSNLPKRPTKFVAMKSKRRL